LGRVDRLEELELGRREARRVYVVLPEDLFYGGVLALWRFRGGPWWLGFLLYYVGRVVVVL
jgi:hypothetical protein